MDVIGPIVGATANLVAGMAIKRPSSRITVITDRDKFSMSGRPHSVFVPVESVDDLAPLPDLGGSTYYSKPFQWVDQQNGCDVMRTSFQFIVHAHNASVDIVGAEPIVERAQAKRGIALVRPPAGGPMDMRHLSVNLDEASAEHRDLGTGVAVSELGKPDQPVSLLSETLKPGESVRFHVEAHALKATYRWALNLHILVNGKERTESLLHNGERPFVTMWEGDPAITARYLFDDGQWVEQANPSSL